MHSFGVLPATSCAILVHRSLVANMADTSRIPLSSCFCCSLLHYVGSTGSALGAGALAAGFGVGFGFGVGSASAAPLLLVSSSGCYSSSMTLSSSMTTFSSFFSCFFGRFFSTF